MLCCAIMCDHGMFIRLIIDLKVQLIQATVVAHVVDQSLPTPEASGSNSVINIFTLFTSKKRGWIGPIKKFLLQLQLILS